MSVREEGLKKTVAKLRRMFFKTPAEVEAENERAANDIKEEIQRNLNGVPGMPQPRTRQYQRSWRVVKARSADGVVTHHVVTDADQSDRLEFGFVGMDSAGRMVHQAPRPHRRPAVEKVRKDLGPRYRKAIRRAVK